MEKKFLFFLLIFVFTFNFVSSLTIQMNSNYSLGETAIARISGTFRTPLTTSNIIFNHGATHPSFDPVYLTKIDNYNYIVYFSIPTTAVSGNYDFVIHNADYLVGNQYKTDDVLEPFVITNVTAFASIFPGLTVANTSDYNISLTNNLDNSITVIYGTSGNQNNSVNLGIYPRQRIITLQTPSDGIFEEIFFSYENQTYSSFIYSKINGAPFGPISPNDSNSTNATSGNNSENQNTSSPSFWDILFGSGKNSNNTVIQNQTNATNQTNNSSGSFWDSLFGGGNKSNQTAPNNSNTGLKTCSQMGFPICQSGESCSGSLVDASDSQCCNGTCTANNSGTGVWGTIGWIILGVVVVLGILFFVFRFSRTRRGMVRLRR